MNRILGTFIRFAIFYLYIFTFFLKSGLPTFAQQGSYSTLAKKILDDQNSLTSESSTELDIFKFSINDILNSQGETIENSNGDPTIFGRTDYGSEFALSNDLSTSSIIEIPAFVINDLAETNSGEYFPIIKNGDSDAEDGTYINTYTDNTLGTQVTEYFNADAPDKIQTTYDYGTTEIEYLSDSGIDVKDSIFEDGSVSKSFFIDNEMDILASTYAGADGFTSRYFVDPDSKYTYSTSNNVDGSVYSSFYDGSNISYSQTVDNNNEIINSYYYDDEISLNEISNSDGTSQTIFSDIENDGSGEFKRLVENRAVDNTITSLLYTDQDNANPIEFTLDNETTTNAVVTQTFKSEATALTIVKTNTGGDIRIVYGGENVFEYLSANKDNLVNLAPNVIANGENVIANGVETVAEANSATNPNSLAIDFKDLYDTEDGLVITPELGYVRLNSADGNQYINLSNGDVIEFFVRPTDTYLENHNSEDLFFIDRPVPTNPTVTETDTIGPEYSTDDSSSSESETSIYIGPGEEAITLPSGEIKVYVTTVYVQAPASNFLPSQIVMPVKSDGDFNYDVEPAAAETFPDEIQVVAIPEKKAEEISEKVKQIKKEKEAPSNPKHDEDSPPPLDPGIEAMLKLNIFLNDVQKGPSKLLAETKKTIQKEFPNMSNELITLIISIANTDEKFDLIKDPKDFLDKEFSKSNDPLDLNSLLDTNLSSKELIKIYNLIIYKFSAELAEFGFGTLTNQKFNFSKNVFDPDQILDQVQLQKDIMAIVSLLGLEKDNQTLSNLLIEPVNVDPESSTALFQSNQSQKLLSQIKVFSKVINSINNLPRTTPETKGILDSDIPLIELNVRFGQNIAEALKEKLAEDKRLNSDFQPRSQSSKLEKFNFELPSQDQSSTPPKSPPLIAEPPNITDQELQLITETTEATNNILDGTIDKMLGELGDTLPNGNTIEIISATNNLDFLDQENDETKENVVFSNALSSVQRLEKIEDIRAIFEILGIGS